MRSKLPVLLSIILLAPSHVSLAQSKLPVFKARAVGHEDAEVLENWGHDCGLYCAISPAVKSSSRLAPLNPTRYGAEQAHDSDLGTAWVEGVAGDGIGEYLEYTFAAASPKLAVTSMTVCNGYRKSAELWRANSRVKSLKIYVNGKPYGIVELEDAFNNQSADIGEVKLSARRKTVLRFEVLEVYRGEKYTDTAITELTLDGTGHH